MSGNLMTLQLVVNWTSIFIYFLFLFRLIFKGLICWESSNHSAMTYLYMSAVSMYKVSKLQNPKDKLTLRTVDESLPSMFITISLLFSCFVVH